MARRLARGVTGVLLVAAIGVVLLVAAARAAGWSVSPVLTGSMRPTFDPGDLVVTRSVPTDELSAGNVAVFVPPGETASYAHRVLRVSGPDGARVLRTKGDANPTADAWQTRLTAPTVPVVAFHVPRVGNLLVGFTGPSKRPLLIALLGLSLTAMSVRLVLTPPPHAAIS